MGNSRSGRKGEFAHPWGCVLKNVLQRMHAARHALLARLEIGVDFVQVEDWCKV